jgi:phage recombination protein Bet
MATTALATAAPRVSLVSKIAQRYSVEPGKLLDTLKATAFKGNVTNEQMMALLIVADQHGLNPFTKEIYAFPDKQNGIVPVVGVDGWARIINEHPQFDGMEFSGDRSECTCTIWRKDRAHPIIVTEYIAECRRDTGPWRSHPMRMLRHKAMIQCARLAFGFAGIHDPDEAERVLDMGAADEVMPPKAPVARVQAAITRSAQQTVDADSGEILERSEKAPAPPAAPPAAADPNDQWLAEFAAEEGRAAT